MIRCGNIMRTMDWLGQMLRKKLEIAEWLCYERDSFNCKLDSLTAVCVANCPSYQHFPAMGSDPMERNGA